MMRYLCGEAKEIVTRRTTRELKRIDCPDVHSAIITFKNGAIRSLTTTWAYDENDWSHANILHITFADKLLRWTSEEATVSGGGAEPQVQRDRGRSIDEIFVDAVRKDDGSAILSPYHDAVKTLELCLAVNESGETGQPVNLA